MSCNPPTEAMIRNKNGRQSQRAGAKTLLVDVAAKAASAMARGRRSEDAARGNLRGASAAACCLSNFYSPVGLLDTSLAAAAVI